MLAAGFLFVPGPRLARVVQEIAFRLAGPRGLRFVALAGNTVRSVARGIIGIALLQAVLMGAVMITTYFTEAFKMTLVFGVPFLLILSAVYYGFFRKGRAKALNKALA